MSTRKFLDTSTFQDVLRRIGIHAELLGKIKQRLPGPLANHCHYCMVREDGCLVVFTDSPAWASQLRFFAPSILATIKDSGCVPISQVLIRNLHRALPPRVIKPMPPMQPPPPRVIEIIKESSRFSPHAELGEAFARLGATMENYAEKIENPPFRPK